MEYKERGVWDTGMENIGHGWATGRRGVWGHSELVNGVGNICRKSGWLHRCQSVTLTPCSLIWMRPVREPDQR